MTHTRAPKIEVISRNVFNGLWIKLLIPDSSRAWYAQAQVFDTPSKYGIGARDNEGNYLPGASEDNLPASARISRLAITSDNKNWGSAAVYNYDRGLDFDTTPPGLLDTVIRAVLEKA